MAIGHDRGRQFVSQLGALAEQILIARISPAVSLKDMSTIADLPWVAQKGVVFPAE
jgi:hypothetical protein